MRREDIVKQLQLRLLTLDDLDEFNKLLRYAFQVTNDDLLKTGWNNEEIKQAKTPILKKAQVLGYFQGANLVSQIALYPMQMNVYGKIFKMCGITGVATYPEYSSLGLMKNLMKEALVKMRENAQSISCLYPYSIPYYRSRGWEIISDKMTFKLKDNQLPKTIPTHGIIKRVKANDKDLIDLHNIFARQTHGCLVRDELAWDEYWRWDVEDEMIAIYYNEAGEPRGYVVYLLENDVFFIKEMIYLDTEANMGLWNYIKAHNSMFDELRGANYSNETLSFLLDDGSIKETIMPYIMARIVDVELFFKQYPFDFVAKKASISFEISDSLLEWNNKTFNLKFEKDQVIFDSKKSKNKIKLDIQTLSTMFLGYKRPLYLKKIGRLQADKKSIDLLEEILPEGKAYFSDYF